MVVIRMISLGRRQIITYKAFHILPSQQQFFPLKPTSGR